MLRYVLKMNKTLNARLLLLHVYETPVSFTTAKFAMAQDLELLREAQEKMAEFQSAMSANPLYRRSRIETMIEPGLASERIIGVAFDRKAGLIAMAASSLTRVERLVVGSNATRVIKKAPCMVLVVPPQADFKGLRKIIFATDLRNDNVVAGKALGRFLKPFDTAVHHVHVKVSKKAGPGNHHVEESGTTSPKKKKAFTITAPDITSGLGSFIRSSKPDALAVFHRARNIFGAITDASLSKRLSFSCSTPVLILHAGDRALFRGRSV